MTEAGWDDVLWSVDSAIRHFEAAAAMSEDGPLGAGDATSYRNEMALMHAMQSGYTSFENALTRTLKLLDEDAPVGADRHRQLVERCGRPIQGTRPAILPREILPPSPAACAASGTGPRTATTRSSTGPRPWVRSRLPSDSRR